jgi:glucosamine-phosphate N-acetyltransferase
MDLNILNLSDEIKNISNINITEYLKLLTNLTHVYNDTLQLEDMIHNFRDYVNNLPNNNSLKKNIYLVYNENKLIGTVSLIIEQKIIHNYGKVGIIEDVVIDKSYQKKGFGKYVINQMINKSKQYNCYKVILNCKKEFIPFYEKCTPKNTEIQHNHQISYYLH